MTKWTVDTGHSSIGFSVKHMMISKVIGTCDMFKAEVEAQDLADLTWAKIAFHIDGASINTRNEERDKHLWTDEFFDVEQHPSITFESTDINKTGDSYFVTGNLTMRGITNEVTFDTVFNGKGTNPWGKEVYAFEAKTIVDREDFGITWNQVLEMGGVLVGKEVEILVELEVIQYAG